MNTFSIQEAVRFGWSAVRKNIGFFIVATLLVLGISFLSEIINPFQPYVETGGEVMHLLLTLVYWVLNFVLGIWVIKVGLDAVDAKRLTYSSMVPTWEVLWKFVLSSVVVSLIVFVPATLIIGLITALVFGSLFAGLLAGVFFGPTEAVYMGFLIFLLISIILYFSARFTFATYYVVDQRLGPIQSAKASWRATRGIVLKIIGLMLVLAVLNMVGVLALIVGLLVTIPISLVATAHVYRSLAGSPDGVPTPTGEVVEPVPVPEIGSE